MIVPRTAVVLVSIFTNDSDVTGLAVGAYAISLSSILRKVWDRFYFTAFWAPFVAGRHLPRALACTRLGWTKTSPSAGENPLV